MKLPRKILEHWPGLSGNAAKLLVWLTVNVDRHGLLETSFEDIGRGCGWVWKKTTQGTLVELEAKQLIQAKRATNQHASTRIRILNCGRAEQEPVASAGDSNPAEDITEDKNYSGGLAAEALTAVAVQDVGKDKNHFAEDIAEDKALRKRERAESIENAIADGGHLFTGQLDDSVSSAFAYLEWECDRRFLSLGFVCAVTVLYQLLGKSRRPGKLATGILDLCLSEQRALLGAGKDPAKYFWSPGFQGHRDALRRRELGRLPAEERVAQAVA